MSQVATALWLLDIGRSLRTGFFMFWETLWPLVLGFGLSGAVQAFVSRDAMQRSMGDPHPASIARASAYGMASSSCSYAASAMSKSLFSKGADFVAANVFMFASTNLVVELGILLAVLIGWQFAVSEFVGGAIMIVLFAVLGSLWFRGRQIAEARRHLETTVTRPDHVHRPPEDVALQHQPWRRQLRSKGGWADAATYTMSDLTMLRRELVLGYVLAGFLATVVPASAWSTIFLHGHGALTTIENVVIGPFIAMISFVCSVGNVPLAAALWAGGISFGGVISFIFADLLAIPLLLIYRRYYGLKLMLKMLALFWLVMSLAGLVTEGLFRSAGLVPTHRPAHVVAPQLAWNYTTILNIVFLTVFGVLYWTYRNRVRLGGGRGTITDPVCGMVVVPDHATALVHDGTTVYFCSDGCRDRFEHEHQPAGADPRELVTTAAHRAGRRQR